jgi:acyl-CoA synthetase (NDP forming)
MDSIAAFFNAGSVALIGATDKEGATGRVVLENLVLGKDKRKIFPVNPRREKVLEIKCYPNVSSLPEVPDLAIVVIPADLVAESVEDCGKAGVKSIIII